MNGYSKTCLFYLSVLIYLPTSGQHDSLSRHAIYAELLGNGGFYSINYDHTLFKFSNSLKLSGRMGYSFYDRELWLLNNNHNVIVEVNLLWGERKKFLETGIGYSYMVNPRPIQCAYVTPLPGGMPDLNDNVMMMNSLCLRLGFRYQRDPDGLLFRFAFTPLINLSKCRDRSEKILQPWAGISIGHAF